ncbi:glycosyltransferase family 2 protein [Leptonema illini]|uniref:Glycosyl transferase family 2 n=1 Tax=Leptonema illini DSM 21528 TaxID=929563 RepID=H2CAX6_9LEPT|nr:glycosyltransferase family A protein [Leptonema illini]EHQ08571.1 glycosyl transferase family 2 [Leptonema illini DSM 21528]
MPDVSVIIPVRKRPQLLKEALASVLAGTVLPDEILVVLDGSREELQADAYAAEEMRSLCRSDTTLTILYGPGRGPALARNIGAARARHSLLAFLDSDDLWQPHKLQEQLAYMTQRPHLHASHCAETWLKGGTSITVPARLQPSPGRLFAESLEHCLVSASSAMIRRSTFFALGGFDPALRACEDYDLWIRYFLRHPMGMVPPIPVPHVVKRSGQWQQLSATRSIDRFRVQSLYKILQTEQLTDEQRGIVLIALKSKWNILNAQKKKYGFPDNADYDSLEKNIEPVLKAGKE